MAIMEKVETHRSRLRYFYVTMLREPMLRFISEYRHVQRGANWPQQHMCNGRMPTAEEILSCHDTDGWENVTLDAFLACESNNAFNRQTRMLADLPLSGCYERGAMTATERYRVMLASAKRNLDNLAFFGLAEQQELTQFLFEQTFKLRFTVAFAQTNGSSWRMGVTQAQSDRVRAGNALDTELYRHAESVFAERVAATKARFPAAYERFMKKVNASDASRRGSRAKASYTEPREGKLY
ncbi:PREDICTED: heparan-sulfate 6-O-sulfotransferase 3-like [Priapulus caudatus]|uniref:Heparan-sulfate 6-O-sulfotransferase n=1 Tax=Priapulus caudatus TaxID=37621 RepID=A0ABM1ESR4_PRICU|nr:PREDICTED: heparan-sulfate 6-O-sulfotransferase 3-like [Priapulus caudatus]